MAATDTAPRAAPEVGDAPDGAIGPRGRRLRPLLRDVGPLALELAALTTFVYARPVLSAMGRSTETFVVRGADWTDMLVFLFVVVAVPAVGLAAVDVVARLVGSRWLRWVHAGLVGTVGALLVWQIGGQFVDMSFLPIGGALCGLAGLGLAVLRHRSPAMGTYLRYASLIVVVVVVQFVFMSSSGAIVLGQRHLDLDPEVGDAVAAAVGDDAPPVVLLVFDGLPTDLLLDGQGAIDPELYPNLAELAGTSTWYRNNTTVAPMTMRAVPAILSGGLPHEDTPPLAASYPENLFTMLGGTYDVHALEPLTGLCPVSLCPVDEGSPLDRLLGDSRYVWKTQMGGRDDPGFFVPGAFDDRYGQVDDFLDAQDFRRDETPDAYVMHVLLPHDGWQYLDDGSRYVARDPVTGMWAYTWGQVGAEVGRQRHILQTQLVDRMVGRVMDELRDAGTFDDAVMVVTADHGYAFDREAAVRGLTEDNYAEIMWTPLIVKSPGQRDGVVDDRNTLSVDVLPTIAHELGVDLPWDDLQGVPASEADRDPADKPIADWEFSTWRPDEGTELEVDGEEGFAQVLAADPVTADGPLALWDRTDGRHGDLVGRSVDDLQVVAAQERLLTVQELDQWEDVDPERPPIELLGYTGIPIDSTVAVSIDGTIAAVVPAGPGPYGSTAVHALLWPDALSAGENEVETWVVGGTPEAPTLSALQVVPH